MSQSTMAEVQAMRRKIYEGLYAARKQLDAAGEVADISDRKRTIRISPAQLAEALGCPPGSVVDAVSEHLFFDTGDYAIRVCSPAFDRVAPCHAIPTDVYVPAPAPAVVEGK